AILVHVPLVALGPEVVGHLVVIEKTVAVGIELVKDAFRPAVHHVVVGAAAGAPEAARPGGRALAFRAGGPVRPWGWAGAGGAAREGGGLLLHVGVELLPGDLAVRDAHLVHEAIEHTGQEGARKGVAGDDVLAAGHHVEELGGVAEHVAAAASRPARRELG